MYIIPVKLTECTLRAAITMKRRSVAGGCRGERLMLMRNNTLVVMHWTIDPELNYLHVDASKERLLRMPEGSLAGTALTDDLHPDDASMLRKALANNPDAGILAGCSLRYSRPQSAHIVTDATITPMFDAQWNLKGFHGKECCIAAMRRGELWPTAETALARAAVGICIVSREARLLAVNRRYAALTARPVDELIGCPLDSVGIPSKKTADEAFAAFDAGTEIPERDIVINGKDHTMTAYSLPDACGSIRSICIFFRDISRRKNLERKLETANSMLEEIIVKDYLTGVFNRRHFDDMLEKEVARVARAGGELSMCMVDVDKFKLFNDAYGHLAGDECLANVAGTMGKMLHRPGDQLFRYGGEEFAIILPNTGRENAVLVAERVRQAVADLDIPHTGSALGHVTISIGVAGLDAGTARLGPPACQALIRMADTALYAAKSGGRNKVASGRCKPEDVA